MRERAPAQVRKKLERWKLNDEEQDQLITYLQDQHFLNEQRFANAYARDKFRFNNWGKIKLRIELRHLEIQADTIEDALNGLPEEEYRIRLVNLALSKWQKMPLEQEYIRKQKTVKYLMGKGFEQEFCWKAVHEVSAQEQNH